MDASRGAFFYMVVALVIAVGGLGCTGSTSASEDGRMGADAAQSPGRGEGGSGRTGNRGPMDAGMRDASEAGGPAVGAGPDGGDANQPLQDAAMDTGSPDAGMMDVGDRDGGRDAGNPDAGKMDVGDRDSGRDAGSPDAGKMDVGDRDGGMDASDGSEVGDAGNSCPSLTFGPSCQPVTCQNGMCNRDTCWGELGDGSCDVCDEGWTGDNCDVCAPDTFSESCVPVTCQQGTCGEGTCSGAGDGHCDSCDPGWVGEDCDECVAGAFGDSCSPVTCENGTCDPGSCSGVTGDGHCDSCEDGWLGPDCAWRCEPFSTEPCYAGSDATRDVGACRAGTRVCSQDGLKWSSCIGQVTPLAEDVCNNGRDDNCSGSQADEVCPAGSVAAWVDGKTGSDATGDGSYGAPFATLARGLQTGRELIMLVADADGTSYEEDIALSRSNNGVTVLGWGPRRPTLVGAVSITHCYDFTFQNVELAYPDIAEGDPAPRATVYGVHNYRGVWRNVRFSAPSGLPEGAALYTTHHGYDNLFVDVEVDDVVLAPEGDAADARYVLLDAGDHGTGSQFIRVTLGDVSLSGPAPDTLDLGFIEAWGYCDQLPEGVTTVRNVLVTGLDMSRMASGATSFRAFDLGCYLSFEVAAGFVVLNNTVADITATSVTFATLDLPEDMRTWTSGNIVSLRSAETSVGLTSNRPAPIDYSSFDGVTTVVSGSASRGPGVLTDAPGFVGSGDYRLAPGSTCIDSGDPGLSDSDGTRSDRGAYGGPLAP